MATPAQIRTAVDNRLAVILPTVQARQDAYFAANGSYWQGLRTQKQLADIAADGATKAGDIGTDVPGYQNPPTPWPLAIRNLAMECSLECHCYEGPNERKGYVLFAYVQIVGRLFARSLDSGPEPWRTQPWTDVTPVTP